MQNKLFKIIKHHTGLYAIIKNDGGRIISLHDTYEEALKTLYNAKEVLEEFVKELKK